VAVVSTVIEKLELVMIGDQLWDLLGKAYSIAAFSKHEIS